MNTADKIIMLPRYTSFSGSITFKTAPMNVRVYYATTLHFDLTGAMGSPEPSVDVRLQESPDLEQWFDVGAPLSHTQPSDLSLSFEWVRLVVSVSGDDPVITCWCVGEFVRRHR